MQCKKDENLNRCKCTSSSCVRKGVCCECIAYHRAKNQLPGCYADIDVK